MAFSKDLAWEYLEKAHTTGRLGHAYLITGPTGSGKNELAAKLSALATNSPADSQPFSHSDIRLADPESKSRRIKIEQIRELEQLLRLKANGTGRKVAVIRDADRLQPQASNAFLKTLEEPPDGCLLLLLTSQPELLLDTIISRCVQVNLKRGINPPPSDNEVAVLDLLSALAREREMELPQAFGLVRDFQALLGGIKKGISDANADELKAEEALYKQTSDGKWLAEREDYFKALTEATYLRERSRLLEVFTQWWADVLRQQRGITPLDFPEFADATAALAERTGPEVLEKIDRLGELRDHLERNVQEALALEVAFLEVFLRD